METSLHRTLKERYALEGSGRPEIAVRGFRVDAIDSAGRLVEFQSGALGPLRPKLRHLLPEHKIRVVKPVILHRRLIKTARPGGAIISSRRSPKCGSLLDIFDDFIGLARIFPHANLEIEVLGVAIDEIRVPRRRWPGFRVTDRRLGAIHETRSLIHAADLWKLMPASLEELPSFTAHDLAHLLDRPLSFAQRVCYCLRLTGAAQVVGKIGNRLVYERERRL
jgi:hypothetical protein